MKILKDAGEFVVLSTWPSMETNSCAQMPLERAGRTCYQSEKGQITPESSTKFVTNVMKRGHYSVIEHGWRGYIITNVQPENLLFAFWPEVKFMFVTRRSPSEVLISGNLETWRKLYTGMKLVYLPGIVADLEAFAPAVFNMQMSDKAMTYAYSNLRLSTPIITVDQLRGTEEMLTHIAHTVQYNGHSRGFTHELVRHRVPVFSQESTRYVDESDFEVVVPPHMDEKEKIVLMGETYNKSDGSRDEMLQYFEDKGYSLEEWLQMNREMYTAMRLKGWKPEDARQVLPTAIKAQIVMSCNLLERRYMYFRRCSKAAHWEIRRTMCDELIYMQSAYPTLFCDFVYNTEAKAYDVPDCTGYFTMPTVEAKEVPEA
jgi:flavin-dependent thymidylate synthase